MEALPVALVLLAIFLTALGAYHFGSRTAAGVAAVPASAAVPLATPAAAVTIGPSPAVVVEPSAAVGVTIFPSTAAAISIGPEVGLLVIGGEGAVAIGPSDLSAILVSPSRDDIPVAGPASATTVKPPPRGAWEERGWTRQGSAGREMYIGEYEIAEQRAGRRRRFPGRIEMHRGIAKPFVSNLPDGIRRHPKWPCFHPTGKPGWFEINWYRPAHNVDDGILYVERVLDEVVNPTRA